MRRYTPGTKINIMRDRNYILLGGLIILIVGTLSIFTSRPTVISPYSFPVIIPAFFISASRLDAPEFFLKCLYALPFAIFYMIWVSQNLTHNYKLSGATKVLTFISLFLSILWYFYGYEYGVKYKGLLQVNVLVAINICFLITLVYFFKTINNGNMSGNLHFHVYHIVLFSWLAWAAFPWLGELP